MSRSRPYSKDNIPTTKEVLASFIDHTHSGYPRTHPVEQVKREVVKAIEGKGKK